MHDFMPQDVCYVVVNEYMYIIVKSLIDWLLSHKLFV